MQEESSHQKRPRFVKLVEYDDDDVEPTSSSSKINLVDTASATSPCGSVLAGERELQLPIRKKRDEELNTESFLGESNVLAHKKAHSRNSSKSRPPQLKKLFQKISWKLTVPNTSSEDESSSSVATSKSIGGNNDGNDSVRDGSNNDSVGSEHVAYEDGASAESATLVGTKRKILRDDTAHEKSLLKKTKIVLR